MRQAIKVAVVVAVLVLVACAVLTPFALVNMESGGASRGLEQPMRLRKSSYRTIATVKRIEDYREDVVRAQASIDRIQGLLHQLPRPAPGAGAGGAAPAPAADAPAPGDARPAPGQGGAGSDPVGRQVPWRDMASATPRSSNVVIGLAHSTLPTSLAVFLASFREVNPKDEVVLLLNAPVMDRTVELLERHRATGIVYDEATDLQEQWRAWHPSSFRWSLFLQYMQAHKGVQSLLMIDARDAAFQRDPFQALAAEAPGFYTYEESDTIGENGWNRGWIEDCFGKAEAQRIAKHKVTCSGVSIGTRDDVLDYLGRMDAELRKPSFDACERNGVDQGVHNVLVRRQPPMPGLRLQDQRSGWIAHMQSGIGRVVELGEGKLRVENHGGEPYAIVHQYDRRAKLARYYLQKYVHWDLAGDGSCAAFTIEKDVDLFFKACDFGRAGEVTAETCCAACNIREGCTGWVFHNGCWLKNCDAPASPHHALPSAVSGFRAARRA